MIDPTTPQPTHVLTVVTPIPDDARGLPRELMDAAMRNLPDVAAVNGVRAQPGHARVSIRAGRDVQGAQGCAIAVVVVTPVHVVAPVVAMDALNRKAPTRRRARPVVYATLRAHTGQAPAKPAARTITLPATAAPMPPAVAAQLAAAYRATTAQERDRALMKARYANSAAAQHDPALAAI